MEQNHIGKAIAARRRALGLTQQEVADRLCISFQAVSKWETGVASPDISYLPRLASLLGTSVDTLLGYAAAPGTVYEQVYREEGYYWGLAPNRLCYEIMRLRPPVKPYRVLELGCGEGKDAVFLARNGYRVTAFDLAQSGLEKARRLAEQHHVHVDLFQADLRHWRPAAEYDIVFSSGALYYADSPALAADLVDSLKAHTPVGGLHALNVFVKKPFIPLVPGREKSESNGLGWRSGELFTYYHDWFFHLMEERVFDCCSSGIPHQHCMDVLVAEKKV